MPHQERIGVLLVNLGTPDAPTRLALKSYLREFLSDRRVVDLPAVFWWPLLHGVILTTRPARSAKKYARIWTDEGSPLKVNGLKQAAALSSLLGEGYRVCLAMRYGTPSVEDVIQQMMAEGISRILAIPLYPQYAASSTGSAFDAVFLACTRLSLPPELRTIRDYFSDTGYIHSLTCQVRSYWDEHGRGNKLIMSFHGVPCQAIRKGDPYALQCEQTAKLLAEALGLEQQDWKLTFQSRFGRAQWLQPYTQKTLEDLAEKGVKRVDVICPGFSSDCLETLEEINMECRAAFLDAGGHDFHYIPALNDSSYWIEALARLVKSHGADWPGSPWLSPPGKDYSCPGCSCR
ncbi:MAG: ferrochelatase [Proteobacteria bacterium]|nr:ferrochelatase [Pseudomonadota bacterium]